MECYSVCTAASYLTKALDDFFRQTRNAARHREVIYVNWIGSQGERGDVFFFPYGAFVSWGLNFDEVKKIREEIRPFEETSLDPFEKDKIHFTVNGKSLFKNDHISLADDNLLTKLAFSHGLAQSVKLGTFEIMIQSNFEKTKYLPEALAKHGRIPLSRKEIRRCMGILFLERSSINLHVNVLDTPEFFWEYPQYESIYQMTAVELDLQPRAKALNHQLDVMHDLFEMLGNELNHQHSSRLELAIIILIILEVALVFFHDILKLI